MADKKTDGEELHTFHPVLTDEQYQKAQQKARDRVDKERIEAAMKEIEEKAYTAEQRALGISKSDLKDDLVSITIDLVDPDINSCLVINFKQWWHGQTYHNVPRHVADYIQMQAFNLAKYTSREIEGKKDREFYRKKRNITLGPTGDIIAGSAPQRVAS